MAYNILSGNLNRFGNAGAFESDISTWGGITGYVSQLLVSRTSASPFEGLYSLKAEVKPDTIGYIVFDDGGELQLPFCVGGDSRPPLSNNFVIGKKYLARARVKVYGYGDSIVRTDIIKFRVYGSGVPSITAPNFEITKTVGEVYDDGGWVELEAGWTSASALAIVTISVYKSSANSGTLLTTSTTSFTLPTAIDEVKTLTVDTGLTLLPGSWIKVYNDATHFLQGMVQSYDSDTGALEVLVKSWTGTGTYSAWDILRFEYPAPFGVDKFQILEYEDIVEPCTLAIDVDGTDVEDETADGAGDGSINVAITGGTGPFEYSKNGGSSWQSSPLFTGLSDGIYVVVVREVDRISCNSTQTFAVNAGAAPGFDFTTTKIDETLAGAVDGRIEVTVTGAGTPFTFSKDGGLSYQPGNVFTGLAPGTYTIVVKDTDDLIVAKNVTILAGYAVFEKAWFSRNPITFRKGATSGWDSLTNYRLYDDVRIEDEVGSGSFVSKLKTTLYPDDGGNVTFQVRQAMKGSLTANPPSFNSGDIIRLTDRIKLFRHYTGFVVDLDTTPETITASNPHLVLLGGLNKFSWPNADFFGSFLSTAKKFMTWAPIEKQVDRNQEDYLNYFVFTLTTTTLKVRVKVYYDDNTNTTATIKTKSGVAYGQLYQLPAGPSNTGIHLIDPDKTVVKYELWLLNQSDAVISEVRTYVIDTVSHPRKRLFMALNSLGSYEVIRFTGAADHATDIGKDQVVKYLPASYSSLDGEKEVYSASMQERSSLSSGFFDDSLAASWLDYMKEFLLSRKVYDVTDGKRRPIVVLGGQFPTGADQDYTRFIRFTALDSYEDENYTPKNSGL